MRIYHHTLERSKSRKSIIFKVHVDDRFGKQRINQALLSGWRAKLAEKRLFFDKDDWDDDVARKFVGIMVLKIARDEYQGTHFLNNVDAESNMEIHFWAYQFLSNKKASHAWKILNGDIQ